MSVDVVNNRVPLSFLLAENKVEKPPVEPAVPFPAHYGDELYMVKRLDERTALVESLADGGRMTVRHESLTVVPKEIQWRTKSGEPRPPGVVDGVVTTITRHVPELAREEKEMAHVKTKRCSKCGKDKPVEDFAMNASKPDGRQGSCRSCMKAYWSKKPAPQDFSGPAAEAAASAKKPKTSRRKRPPHKTSQVLPRKQATRTNGRPPVTFKDLVGDVKSHIATLRKEHAVALATIASLQAEKAELFAQLQEVISTA